jgi:Cu/Ag efflux protein CusF
MTSGVVKKVDKGAGKVTIRHGPLENLGMPQMTMVFRVKDPAMLDRLKEGDKILFVAEKVDGAFTVMSFESAK